MSDLSSTVCTSTNDSLDEYEKRYMIVYCIGGLTGVLFTAAGAYLIVRAWQKRRSYELGQSLKAYNDL